MKTLLVSSILLLAVAACGGSTGSSGDAASAAPSVVPTPAAASAALASATPAAAAASAMPAESPADDATPVEVSDFAIDPSDIAVPGPVSLAVSNTGPTVHNVTIRDDADEVLGKTADLREGESGTLAVELPAGTYTMYCSLPGHESLGMKGTLTVGG